MAELVDARDLKSLVGYPTCRFESDPRHSFCSLFPDSVIIDKRRFLCNGVEILVDSDHILVTNDNTLIRSCSAVNCHCGLIIGQTPVQISGFISLQSIERYLGDSKAALASATKNHLKLAFLKIIVFVSENRENYCL